MIANLYIHVANRIGNYKTAIQGNLVSQLFLFVLVYQIVEMFQATMLSCTVIFAYYDKKGVAGDVSYLCYASIVIYCLWVMVAIALTVLRCFSLLYMGKSYRFLYRKMVEKLRRKMHLKQKKKKQKRILKREIQKDITKYRS